MARDPRRQRSRWHLALGHGGPQRARRRSAPMSSTAAKRVLLIGGTSEIGLAILTRLAADGPIRPYLIGRDAGRLDAAVAALAAAGVDAAERALLDADDLDAHEAALGRAFDALRG